MKISSGGISLAALVLGVSMAVAPALAQTRLSHHDAQKTGAAEGMQKIQSGQRGYSTGPLYNYAPGQPGHGEVRPCIHVQTSCL